MPGDTDLRILLWIQAFRAFVYGFGSVLIGSALAAAGMSAAQFGILVFALLAGFALVSILIGTFGDRIGRRLSYGGLFLVMAVAGTAFALTSWLPALVLAALTGTISVEANESGPFTSLEQAMIPHTAVSALIRNRAFAKYNGVAYLAGSFGALAAGGPDLLRRVLPSVPADQRFLLVFPVAALACAWLTTRLSRDVESDEELASDKLLPLTRSRGVIARLAALFAVDSFGGGFVTQVFLVYWFGRKFGASTELLGVVFFTAGLLQAGSSIAAGWLANRFGLLNTMVFTHLPSNFLLIAVPFAGSFPLAVALLLARFAISQMDVPARQAYVVSLVEPGERTAAALYTNTARNLVRPLGPLVGGALMQTVGLAAPFVAAAGLKIAYDFALLATFRRVRAEDG